MLYNFEQISERDMDFLIMRGFAESPQFADIFLSKTPWPQAIVTDIIHSKTDVALGESDITIMVEFNNEKYALLIEDKIDAKAMPEQFSRYHKRGKLGVLNGDYKDYAVFLVAPEKYIQTNEEAKKYDNKITYQELNRFFKESNKMFDYYIVNSSIEKQSTGYVVHEVPAITQFWNKLYEHCVSSSKEIEMYPVNGPKGAKSTWPMFKSFLKGTSLYFKSSNGFVDLEFSGKLNEGLRLKSDLSYLLDPDMHWVETGNSISLRIKVAPLDFKCPFEIFQNEIDTMLDAVERLTRVALKINDSAYQI